MPGTLCMVSAFLGLIGLGAPPAVDGFVTETFGNTERCVHKGALTIHENIIKFDLSSLPRSINVMRAVLRVPSKNHRRGQSVLLIPVGLKDGKPLALRPPYFDSFDATDVAKTWVAKPSSNKGLRISKSGGVRFAQAVLEISYHAKPQKPIQPVTALKAIHQAGQTFLTWKEIEDPVGTDAPTFEDFEKAVLEARKKRMIVYRVYRSDEPITEANLGRAELVLEVPEFLSCWNLKEIKNTEHPNPRTMRSVLRPRYNLVRNHVMTRYRIVEGGKPLPRGTGLAVITVSKPGKRYYAVTAAINGREAVAKLGPGASLTEPVAEEVSAFPAIIYQRSIGKISKRSCRVDVYNSWIGAPYNNVPTVVETYICRWPETLKGSHQNRLPLWVVCSTYGGTATQMQNPVWYGARKYVPGSLIVGLAEGGVWQGFHECIGTLKGYDQGVVHNYPQRRVLAAAAWGIWKKDLFIDPERVYFWAQMGAWALRHGDTFAVVMSNGQANPCVGKEMQKHGWKWGPYPKGAKNWLGIDQWEYMNLPKWIREHPEIELPYWMCWPAKGAYPSHTIGDFGFMPWPEIIHAMASTKRAFAATWSSSGPGPLTPLLPLVKRIRLHQSLPAFTNCSLDHSPGDGDFADAQRGGGINVYQLWDPETIVDESDTWEITVYLGQHCPFPEAITDLTPRRTQKFKAKPGERFIWVQLAEKDGEQIASGTAVADEWGLVTVEKLKLTKDKSRIRIARQ